MADDLITIRLRLTGGTAAAAEAKAVSGQIAGIGTATGAAGVAAGKADKPTSRFRNTLGSLGKAVRYSAIPGLALLGYGIGSSIGAYREARKVAEETNARIKSTGKVANVSAGEVQSLANMLSLKTGVDDEEIQSAANMLLTFKDIRNEVGKGNDIFDQATGMVLDLAAATKTDGVSAAKQLGKALNDPATGLTALRRSGASFNEEQTETIQKLFDSGKRLKAQKMILKELSSEFEGSARSQHDSVDRLGVAWENLQEKLGEAVFPILQDVTKWLTKALRQAEKGKGPLIDLKNWFQDVGETIDWVGSEILDPFIDSLRTAYRLYKRLHDIGVGNITEASPEMLDPVGSAVGQVATGVGQGRSPGGGPGRGSGPQKVRNRTVAGDRRRGKTERHTHVEVPVYLDGKKLAKGVFRRVEEEAAWA